MGADATTAAGTTTTTTATTALPTPTTVAAADPALVTKAAAANLQLTDFTPGFAAFVPNRDDPNGGLHIEALWNDLARCLGVDNTPASAQATSPTFKRGLATQGVSTVEYTAPSSAAEIAAALSGPASQGCMTTAYNMNSKRSAPEGAVPSAPVITPLNVPHLGQTTFPYRINITMHLGSPPLDIALFHDFYVIVNGGTVIRLWFLNPGSGFPPNLEQSVVKAVVARAG